MSGDPGAPDSGDHFAPSPDAPPPGRAPAPRRGAPRAGATPRMETVRITAPDLARRAALLRTRARLKWASGGFCALFGALALKLAAATVLFPTEPPAARANGLAPLVAAEVPRLTAPEAATPAAVVPRAAIEDRNGQLLAISLPTAEVYANPQEMIDLDDVVRKLHQILPGLDSEATRARLGSGKSFVYLARQISARQQSAINRLGIPGIYFRETGRRRYPLGRVAAQVLGAVDVDQHGVAGAERAFDERLATDPTPLRLSLDVRVQAVTP